jgi:hypothetical protein
VTVPIQKLDVLLHKYSVLDWNIHFYPDKRSEINIEREKRIEQEKNEGGQWKKEEMEEAMRRNVIEIEKEII